MVGEWLGEGADSGVEGPVGGKYPDGWEVPRWVMMGPCSTLWKPRLRLLHLHSEGAPCAGSGSSVTGQGRLGRQGSTRASGMWQGSPG